MANRVEIIQAEDYQNMLICL